MHGKPCVSAMHGCRLFRYGDSMYAYYPQRISSAEDSATSTFANGVRFEFGGLMRCVPPQGQVHC